MDGQKQGRIDRRKNRKKEGSIDRKMERKKNENEREDIKKDGKTEGRITDWKKIDTARTANRSKEGETKMWNDNQKKCK